MSRREAEPQRLVEAAAALRIGDANHGVEEAGHRSSLPAEATVGGEDLEHVVVRQRDADPSLSPALQVGARLGRGRVRHGSLSQSSARHSGDRTCSIAQSSHSRRDSCVPDSTLERDPECAALPVRTRRLAR